ncbi:MAG: hypothetical protein M3Y72_15670, partial [Acidobacteriota bacterium]|nr:hypothetical protein [Acidobacteriota bacterium]
GTIEIDNNAAERLHMSFGRIYGSYSFTPSLTLPSWAEVYLCPGATIQIKALIKASLQVL